MPNPQTARTGFLSPFELAKAWRDEHPGKFDDIGDGELVRAIEVEDPETYKLVDPLLYGAENLPVPKAPPPAPRLVPPPPQLGPTLPMAARVVPAIAGTALGSLGGPIGAGVVGALGASGGEAAAQYLEKEAGPREEYSPASMVLEGALNAFNPAMRAPTMLGRIGAQAGYGAGLGAVGTVGRSLIEDTPLTPEDVAMNTLLGGAFGGATHAGFEGAGAGVRALRNRAPNFGEVLPPVGPEGMRTPVDDLIIQQAAAQQYQQEEATLAKQLTDLFGPEALTTGAKYGDLHTATQAKTYLEELARVTEAREAAEQAVEEARAAAIRGATPEETALFAPPAQKQLPPGPPSFIAYPPGATPTIEEVPGTGIRPGIIANEPPPDPLEEALAASLSQPPGPPRLVTDKPYQALALEAPGGAGTAEVGPPSQPGLLPRTRKPLGRIQQTGEMGGAPPTFEEPHLQGLEPRPLAERPYAEGPNAGPRREGEAHGTPRELRRMVEVGGKSTRETYPSTRPAEDPGTYPAEVRRELAVMAQELEDYPYEQHQGGSTTGQLTALTEETGNISNAVAEARRRGATAGGAVAGAPVYHDIIAAAEGGFKNIARGDMLEQIKAALLQGKGNGLTDAAAQVARQRLQARTVGGRETRAGRMALQEAQIIHDPDAGDALINWHDLQGRPTRGRDLSPYEQAAREMTSAEIRQAERVWQEQQGQVSDESREWFQAVRNEGKNRGIISEEQPGLRMEGPGGAGGPNLFDFEGGPPKKPEQPSTSLVPSPERALQGLTPEAFERVLDTYRKHQGDLPGGGRVIRKSAGQPLWENMTREQQTQELLGHIRQDMEAARGEIQGKPIDYLMDRALDPLDPLSTFYGEVLRAAGAQVEKGRIKLSPELRARHALETGPPKQPTLPGAEGVRSQEIATPEVADLPFALQPPPSKPGAAAPQADLFGPPPAKPKLSLKEAAKNELKSLFEDESGELILGLPPAGDRRGLKAWMKQLEDTHGGEAWYNRVEQAMDDGDWDRAWKTAAGAMVRTYTKARAAATTPQQQAALAQAVKGTILQEDLSAQIIAVGRQGQQKRPAPKMSDLPPSYKVTTRQQGQGMELGPAGIINPGPPTMKLPAKSRATTLDKDIMDTFVEELADVPDLLHLVHGNRDAALRLGRQVTDLVVQGQVKFDPADFPGMTREEVGRQYMHTLSEAGRILGAHGNFVQAHADELYEMANRMDMGAALAGTLGSGRRAPMGARGRVSSPKAAEALDRIAQQTATPAVATNLLLNDLQRPPKRSIGDKLMDSQYAFLTSGFATAMRNAYTGAARYGWDLLDQALSVPFAAGLGEKGAGRTAGALLRERVGARHTNFAVSPLRAARAENFEQIYNIQAAALADMAPSDARRTLKILSEYPDEAAHMIGFAGGEELATEGSGSVILDKLLDPKLQRWLTLWNRAQEFTGRGLTFDTHFRAQLRARGKDPIQVLANPSAEAVAKAVGGDRELQDMLRYASNAALEMTWAGQLANRSVPGALVNFVQSYWPAKLVQRFPRFNFSAAPRWIYDHSPAALLDLVRLPFDNAGWTSTGKVMGGGRLYRGLKSQMYQTDVIPGIRSEVTQTQGLLGDALLDLQSTSREYRVRQRQVTRLEARAQTGLPGTQTALGEAQTTLQHLGQRRDRLKGEVKTHKTTIQDLSAQEEKLWKEVQNATGISAPTWSSWMARMTSGTFGLLGAAVVIRSQAGAEGTRFYQYRIENEEGKDPYMLDLRAAAPFVQYLMVGDVLVDFWRHTNWDQAGKDAEAAGSTGRANPINWTNAVWDNYEGKYTKQLLGAELSQAFLSISRAAGTSLTIADLMTRNGWPGPNEAADAIIGTIGQFLAGYATPLGQVKDLIGQFSEEEAQVRSTPRPSTSDPASSTYPLAEGLGRVPLASRLLPPTYSQTTGQPIRSVNPGVRALTGVGGTQADFIQEEVRRVGLPGSSVYFRETGDYGFDTLLAQTYARVLQQSMPEVLEDPEYQGLGTPARQRDYLQQIFPNLKREALGEVKELLGLERVEGAMTGPEERRKQKRQAAVDQLLNEAGVGGELAPFDEPEPAPPGPPPPAPF